MDRCETCGSSARSEYGFCEDCGARWRLTAALPSSIAAPSHHPASAFAKLPDQMNSMDLVEPQAKQVWVAVLLALSLGPFGLFYCAVPGGIVMLIVSIALRLWLGHLSYFVVLPICAVWAWKAASEY
jgi:hypothetical protein